MEKKHGGRFIDMTGKIIDYALVLDVNYDYPKEHNLTDRAIYWNCECLLCGNIFVREGRKLRKNGCKEGCPDCINKRKSKQFSNDLTGQTFYDIYVICRDDEYRKLHNYASNDVIWKCKCLICGSILYLRARQLADRKLPGCSNCYNPKKSVGETIIENILKEYNISYVYNKSYFLNLKGTHGFPLRYDFILLDENNVPYRLIEFDGSQHFTPRDYWGGEEGLKERIYYDQIKNDYAIKNNLPLIRIRYNEEKEITYENLLISDRYLVFNKEGQRVKDVLNKNLTETAH